MLKTNRRSNSSFLSLCKSQPLRHPLRGLAACPKKMGQPLAVLKRIAGNQPAFQKYLPPFSDKPLDAFGRRVPCRWHAKTRRNGVNRSIHHRVFFSDITRIPAGADDFSPIGILGFIHWAPKHSLIRLRVLPRTRSNGGTAVASRLR